MHNNYFFLKQLSASLEKKIKHWKIGACFSQNKNELIIGLYSSGEELYIKADQNPDFSCLSFHSGFSRAKKNSIDLFQTIMDKKIEKVYQYRFERAFSFHLEEEFVLLFKLFGGFSNCLLFHNNHCVEVFKHQLNDEEKIRLEDLDRDVEISREAFMEHSCNPGKWIPAFDATVMDYLKKRNFDAAGPGKKWEMVHETLEYLEDPGFFVKEDPPVVKFSLFPEKPWLKKSTDPLEAVTWFYAEYTRRKQLHKLKNIASRQLRDQIRKSKNYISKTSAKLNELQRSMDYKQAGDILMANLHQIKQGVSKVDLFDFYHDRTITIKLNPKLSPQKNAGNYYRKAKNQRIEIKNLHKNLEEKKKLIETAGDQLKVIETIDNLRELKAFIKANQLLPESSGTKDDQPRFKEFEYMGFRILAGRNAKNNDELTFGYGFKEDLWLHAKDVTGSHTLVKYQPGKTFPKPVIEKAAQYAAYYSRNRNMNHCPVIYTEKKYVRKKKGFSPGTVIVEKENILFVDPAAADVSGHS